MSNFSKNSFCVDLLCNWSWLVSKWSSTSEQTVASKHHPFWPLSTLACPGKLSLWSCTRCQGICSNTSEHHWGLVWFLKWPFFVSLRLMDTLWPSKKHWLWVSASSAMNGSVGLTLSFWTEMTSSSRLSERVLICWQISFDEKFLRKRYPKPLIL